MQLLIYSSVAFVSRASVVSQLQVEVTIEQCFVLFSHG